VPIWKLPPHVAAAIKGIRPTKNGTVLEFRDTVHPAEVRLKVFGRLKETVKVERSLEDIVAQANSLENAASSGTPGRPDLGGQKALQRREEPL